jgi:choline-sulfatase
MTNFVLFNLEETRAESIGCYGNPAAVTPNMDRFASQGVRFEQCHVQHTVCSPSRCSFTTGWYPHVRGHRTLWHLLRPDEPNVFKTLKRAGYQVHWRGGKNDLLAAESFPGSVTSFENRARGYFRRFGPNPHALEDPEYYSFLYAPYADPVERNGDAVNVHAAVDFLRSEPAEPFVLFVTTTLPHPPYSAPVGWHDRIDPASLPALRPSELTGRPAFHELIRSTRRLDRLDEGVLRKIQAVYLGMIGFVDELFGRLVEALEDTGLVDRTAVFLFADHGDYAGDYGLVEKWPSGLEDVLTRRACVGPSWRAPGATNSSIGAGT